MKFTDIKKYRRLYFGGAAAEFFGWAILVIWYVVICFANLPDIYSMLALIIAFAIMLCGCIALVYGNFKLKSHIVYLNKKVYENAKKYAPLPYREIENYSRELEYIRASYAADSSENKNKINAEKIAKDRFVKRSNKDISKFCDYGVLKTGKIYFGLIAFDCFALSSPAGSAKLGVLNVLYGTDEYFESHPQELKNIRKKLYNYFDDDRGGALSQTFVKFKVPTEICGDKDIYLTSVIAARTQFPTGYAADEIVPVIASRESSSAYIVDCEYWSDDFIGNFAFKSDKEKYGEFMLGKILNYNEKACDDYANELTLMREKFTADELNAPVDLLGENPFPSFAFANLKFYYACILDRGDKKRNGKPYVGIYSEDEYFIHNPAELINIAKQLKKDENANREIKSVINLKTHAIQNYTLPYGLTGGRSVIATAIFINTDELPSVELQNKVLPIACFGGENGDLLYSVDYKYWSEGFAYEFVYGKKIG